VGLGTAQNTIVQKCRGIPVQSAQLLVQLSAVSLSAVCCNCVLLTGSLSHGSFEPLMNRGENIASCSNVAQCGTMWHSVFNIKVIFPFHLSTGLPGGLSSFPHQNSVHIFLLPMRVTCPAHLILLHPITPMLPGQQDTW
jgi:hypothetical protein